MSKASQYRDQKPEELESLVEEKRKELFKMIDSQKNTKKLEKPHLLQQTKKEIARLLTVLHEKKQQVRVK